MGLSDHVQHGEAKQDDSYRDDEIDDGPEDRKHEVSRRQIQHPQPSRAAHLRCEDSGQQEHR